MSRLEPYITHHPCGTCGTPIKITKHQRYTLRTRPGYAPRCPEHRWSGAKGQPQRKVIEEHTCTTCGTTFVLTKNQRKRRRTRGHDPKCSRACLLKSRAESGLAMARINFQAPPTRCSDCGDTFERWTYIQTRCQECQDARNEELGQRPTLPTLEIAERDGWVCYLCGTDIDPTLEDPIDPGYINADHVIPRSRGGSDDESNLRASHRYCNTIKSDKLLEELDWYEPQEPPAGGRRIPRDFGVNQ